MSQDIPHKWRFYRAGGLDQISISTGADIANLAYLDPKLWVALACPVKGLEYDEKTLSLIDSDGDDRVRLPEILHAVEFLKNHLRSLDSVVKGSEHLNLADIDTTKPAGAAAYASAKRILAYLGKPDAETLAYSDIVDPVKIFAGTLYNGDGVIIADSAEDPETAAAIVDIIATQGAVADRSGKPGADKAKIDAFFAALKTLADWTLAGETDATLAPFGTGTGAALAAVKAVRGKVDDFFTRGRLAAYDARALTAVNRTENEYVPIAQAELSAAGKELAGFPIAHVEAGAALPLVTGVNPAWSDAVATLRRDAVLPAFGEKNSLTEAEWRTLNARLAPYEAWLAAKPVTPVESLGIDRIRVLLTSGVEARVNALLARDMELAAESAGIDAVEKLVRLNRDFVRLLRNFVTFGDFYDPRTMPVFQAGRLYLDSRECELCIRVADAGKHAAMAGLSKCYLAYCDISRKGAAKQQILAVFSQGDSDYLMVGRNGVFVDRSGNDWDATITKIIDAPISIRQAFFSPYKKFVRMIEEQIAKRAADADADATKKLAAGADAVANAGKTPVAPAAAQPKKMDLGTIALIGTAISGVAAIVGLVLEKFFGLGWYMPLGIIAVLLGISGPSMLIAAIKLRQRNLGPILDANGWAINGRVKVGIPLGTSLTHTAKIPAGSEQSLRDPFAEKRSPWPTVIGVVAALGLIAWGTWASNVPAVDNFISEKLGKPEWVHLTADQKKQKDLDMQAKAKLNAQQEPEAAK